MNIRSASLLIAKPTEAGRRQGLKIWLQVIVLRESELTEAKVDDYFRVVFNCISQIMGFARIMSSQECAQVVCEDEKIIICPEKPGR